MRPKVLFLGIDGCRPDALAVATTPHLDDLSAHGAHFAAALSCKRTLSAPCWATLFTGVWENRHGVTNNWCFGRGLAEFPTLFYRLHTSRRSARSAAIVNWTTRHRPLLRGTDYYRWCWRDSSVASWAAKVLEAKGPDLLFALLDGVDHAGHKYGFHPAVPQYIRAIETADSHVGTVLKALDERRRAVEGEDWLVAAASDHGGKERKHGGASLEERRIFITIAHPAVEDGFPTPVCATDLAVTLMRHLRLVDTCHELDGRSLLSYG